MSPWWVGALNLCSFLFILLAELCLKEEMLYLTIFLFLQGGTGEAWSGETWSQCGHLSRTAPWPSDINNFPSSYHQHYLQGTHLSTLGLKESLWNQGNWFPCPVSFLEFLPYCFYSLEVLRDVWSETSLYKRSLFLLGVSLPDHLCL